MKRAAAVILALTVLFSFFVIPSGASAVREYAVNVSVKQENILADSPDGAQYGNECAPYENILSEYFYELRITLKRSIIFANIAN